MPTRKNTSGVHVVLHLTAQSILSAVEPLIVPKREREANVWLAHAKKLALKERDAMPSSASGPCPDQFWLSCWSLRNPQQPGRRSLDFVLACTTGLLGTYPVFLYSHLPSRLLTQTFLSERVSRLVDQLAALIKPSRVFSVFGPTPLTMEFVTSWTRQTGSVPYLADPFYAAKFSTCTRGTLAAAASRAAAKASWPVPANHTLRLATPADVDAASILCKEFADDSVFFPMTKTNALKEAQEMIWNRQLWVYYIGDTLACIVGCTRTTEGVAAINKVYTNPACRSQGCAGRLVRHVCDFWLNEAQKSAVVLYVAHDNVAAEKAYHRVGFEGLMGTGAVESETEDWLEIGFDGTERGHW